MIDATTSTTTTAMQLCMIGATRAATMIAMTATATAMTMICAATASMIGLQLV